MAQLAEHMGESYELTPVIADLVKRYPEWAPTIDYICSRGKRSIYFRQIERATNANVICFIDPETAKGGTDVFTKHVTKMIRRAHYDSIIWDIYNDLSPYKSRNCQTLIRMLPEMSDKQLRGIYSIIRGEINSLWKEFNYFSNWMRSYLVAPNIMNNFAREIIRGHKAGVLCANRINACTSMSHFVKVIRRALRRLNITKTAITTRSLIIAHAKRLGAKYATALLKTVPVEQRRNALSHYLDTTMLIGVTRNNECAILEDEFRRSVEHYSPQIQTLYVNSYYLGYQERLELFGKCFNA